MRKRSQGAVPAQLQILWNCNRTYRNGLFYRAPGTLNARPGAAAHMSLHLNRQCQRAQKPDALPNPFFSGAVRRLVYGDCRSEPCGPSLRWSSFRWASFDRQRLFAIFLHLPLKPAEICGLRLCKTPWSMVFAPWNRPNRPRIASLNR